MNLYLQCSFAITSKEVLDSIRIYLDDLIENVVRLQDGFNSEIVDIREA